MAKRSWILAPLLAAGTLFAQPAPFSNSGAPAQVLGTLQAFAKDVTEAYRLVQQLQLQARKDKDVIRLNCINDKLIQMKAVRNLFDDSKARAESAATTTEQTLMVDQSRDNWNKMRELREQAQACVGEAQFKSESKSGWESPDIPDDPTKNPFPEHPEDPGYASPYN